MQNRTEDDRSTNQDGAIGAVDRGHTPWCARHEEEVCWSRSILIGETYIDVAMSPTQSGPRLYGLDDFQDALDLDTARQVAAAITELLQEVER